MTNLADYIGTATGKDVALAYIVDGVPMPDSSGKFLSVSPSVADLSGGGFEIGGIPLISGSLTIFLRTQILGLITVRYSIMEGQDQIDSALFGYRANGSVLNLNGQSTSMGPFTASIQRVDNGANTQIQAAFEHFFNGAPITAKLVPKR